MCVSQCVSARGDENTKKREKKRYRRWFFNKTTKAKESSSLDNSYRCSLRNYTHVHEEEWLEKLGPCKGLWRGVGEPLFSPCQKGINEFVNGSHVAELIQHQKVIDYTPTIQWLPHSISTFFGLLRAFMTWLPLNVVIVDNDRGDSPSSYCALALRAGAQEVSRDTA